MMLELTKPIPPHAKEEIDRAAFVDENCGLRVRRCEVWVAEGEAFTYIDPESFDFMDVYGKCEFFQVIVGDRLLPMSVSKYQFEKNRRSFEDEATSQFTDKR